MQLLQPGGRRNRGGPGGGRGLTVLPRRAAAGRDGGSRAACLDASGRRRATAPAPAGRGGCGCGTPGLRVQRGGLGGCPGGGGGSHAVDVHAAPISTTTGGDTTSKFLFSCACAD